MTTAGQSSAQALPELRQDLRLVGEITDLAGNRLWKIYDPIHHRFTALDHKSRVLLDVWPLAATPTAIVETAWQRHAEHITLEDVDGFAKFLLTSGLAERTDPDDWRRRLAAAERHRTAYMTRALHNYLFFRIPLADPERFLRTTLPYVRCLGTRACGAVLAAAVLIGLYLVSREWDRFLVSAAGLASWPAVIGMLLAVSVTKLLHELAHGYTAVHHGCRVPTLGIAFILGAPLLYIDVTDSWRLPSRRARLAIDAAGIAVDLAISALATLAWAFLPDGALRDTAFFLATAGWIASLVFNLNPFMKFDGYHLLADALPMPNLQDRAIAVAQWRLRELLFALRHPAPEKLTPRLQSALCIYGWGIAIYRVVLFTAIAIAVYQYFFKLLGIVLFLVEIGYFIVAPLVRELKVWAGLRGPILASRRTGATAVVLGVLLVLLVVPWSTSVTVPAVIEPTDVARLHSPHPARIIGLGADTGARIEAGARLVRLASPKLEHDLTLARLQAAVVDLRLSRLASDPADREQALVLQQQRLALARTIEGIHKQIDALAVTAPLSGTVASLVPHAAVGRWIVASEPVAVVHGARNLRVRGLVEAVDRPRIRPGMPARFVPSDILAPSLDARVASVATANSATLDILELADSFGGAIPTSLAADGRAVPLQAQYAVIASLDADRAHPHEAEPHGQPRVGVLIVYGDAQSLALRFWNRILQVLVRESGL